MFWRVGGLFVETGVKNIFISGCQFPEGQFDDAGRHLPHAQFQQQDIFSGLLQQPAPEESMVAIQLRLPGTSLQKCVGA